MDFPLDKLADAFSGVEELDFRVKRLTLNPKDLETIRKEGQEAFTKTRGSFTFWNAIVESEDNIPEFHIKLEPEKPIQGYDAEDYENRMKDYRRIKRAYRQAHHIRSLPELRASGKKKKIISKSST